MGIISVEQTDRLYWLGRYTERVYTTMRLYFITYDTLIDQIGKQYGEFCRKLDIPEIYTSPEDFIRRYAFDETDCNSMMSNLMRAYDNAIVLREEIGSESLAYIQLAIYEMQKAAESEAPLMEFQRVLDNLMAFWGICDDQILSENVRNILKVGKRVERIDLYGRLHRDREDLTREIHRLTGRIDRCNLKYSQEVLEDLNKLVKEENLDYPKIVSRVEQILEV
ncbi:alpha-E domain-containing protein [Ruminococcus sp. 5_1_39BFAA]|uniref:alpha-E domain-containing protein n=1 Tax=Ruminococcus sp. 5_1_39BFAA TaxID=457412 RepID=UPI003567EEB8